MDRRVRLAGGRVALPDLDLELEGITADAELEAESSLPRGTLTVDTLRDTSGPARFTPLALAGRFDPAGTSVGFQLTW